MGTLFRKRTVLPNHYAFRRTATIKRNTPNHHHPINLFPFFLACKILGHTIRKLRVPTKKQKLRNYLIKTPLSARSRIYSRRRNFLPSAAPPGRVRKSRRVENDDGRPPTHHRPEWRKENRNSTLVPLLLLTLFRVTQLNTPHIQMVCLKSAPHATPQPIPSGKLESSRMKKPNLPC